MDNTECLLTQEEARELALTALTTRWPSASCRIRADEVLVRAFGWVFNIEAVNTEPNAPEVSQSAPPHLVLVHKTSRQVIATSTAYTPLKFATVYERLLAGSARKAGNWCLTHGHLTDGLRSIAEDARRAGLQDISVPP